MSVDPNATGGGGIGAADIYRIGKAYYESARSAIEDITGGKPSKREEAILREAGYRYVDKGTKLERGWVDPTGRGITADEASKRADRLKDVKRAASGGVYVPTKDEIRAAEERERREAKAAERAKREARERTPADKRPTSRAGRIIDTATAILVGTGAADVIRGVFDLPAPSAPPAPPPPREPSYASPDEVAGPKPPFTAPIPTPVLSPVDPPAPPAPKPAPVDPKDWEPILTPVPIYTAPIPAPVPAPPAAPTAMPGGAPVTTAPTPPTAPFYQQALPWVLGLALPALLPRSGKRRRRDPLTVDQPDTLGSLSLASYPLPFPGSGFGGYGSGTPQRQCECKEPSAKRRRKRKRTVCYSGTYVERASGLRKTKRRKVKCQ